MQYICKKCGGDTMICAKCDEPLMLCDCFAHHPIECASCEREPLVKGGQGRSAEELQMSAENLQALLVIGSIVVLGVILVKCLFQ